MSDAGGGAGGQGSVGLAEAVAALRADLIEAQLAGADAEVQLPIGSVTVELSVTAGWTAGGKAGFKVPFVEAGVEGARKGDTGHKVTITFGPPVDAGGTPIRIAGASATRKK